MRNLLAFAAAAVLTLAAVGWYLDWYKVRSAPSPTAGHHNVNIDIDGGKIIEDVRKGEEKLHSVVEKSRPGDSSQRSENGSNGPGKQLPQ